MCGGCCKEVRGWGKSFTATECLLIIMEVILLIMLFICLVFVVLHLIYCGRKEKTSVITYTTVTEPSTTEGGGGSTSSTLPSKCTWKPSQTTAARTHYYEGDTRASTAPQTAGTLGRSTVPSSTWDVLQLVREVHGWPSAVQHVAALVRGGAVLCPLAIVAPRWALGAATCVAAAGPPNTLQVTGAAGGGPLLAMRTNPAKELALLRVQHAVAPRPALLADLLETFTLSLGEHLTLVEYDPNKSSLEAGGVRTAAVALAAHTVCGSREGALCAACYEPGAGGGGGVLLRGDTLLGVAAAPPCPRAVYVAVAPAAAWIADTTRNDIYD